MRDYGVVRVRFWAWARDKELSPAARELALYCLTSPHSTAIGCFRLPVAYIADDLGTVPDTVRDTIVELSRVGFLKHDGKSGWCWIVGYLDHNPIANPNVGKSLVAFIESIPRNLPFFQEFADALRTHAGKFPDGFVKGLANGLANRCTNPMPNQEQEQEQKQTQEQEQELRAEDGAAPDDRVQEVVDLYQSYAERIPKWPSVRKVTSGLQSSIRARLKEHGFDSVRSALETAATSHFIATKGMRGWGLRWLMKPENFAKVIEGYYSGDQRDGGTMSVMATVIDRLRTEEGGQHAADADHR